VVRSNRLTTSIGLAFVAASSAFAGEEALSPAILEIRPLIDDAVTQLRGELPKRIDDQTVFVDIRFDEDGLAMRYQIAPWSHAMRDRSAFLTSQWQRLLPAVCADPFLAFVMEQGLSIRYTYESTRSGKAMLEFRGSVCARDSGVSPAES
jgi:hypothetical protein